MLDTSFATCGCRLCASGASSTFELTQASPTAGTTYSDYVGALTTDFQWTTQTIFYAFPDSAADYTSGTNFGFGSTYGSDNEADYFEALPTDLWAAADFALSATWGGDAQAQFSVSGFTNLNVEWTTDHSDATQIRIAQSSTPGSGDAGAWAYLPGNYSEAGDVWFLVELIDFSAGSWEWSTMIHELGHALGLKHPHDEPPIMPLDMDGMEYTIMSYRAVTGGNLALTAETFGYAQTWMMLDIAALQAMYGADFTPNQGEVVYSWRPDSGNTYVNGEIAIEPGANRVFATIWDGGGNVTYNLSAYSTGVQIDMRPGESSTFSQEQLAFLGEGTFASGNIYNGLLYDDDPRSLIHKVVGGSGNDTITSDDASNVILPGAGSDHVTLLGGNNQVWAGRNDMGNDTIRISGDGNNTIAGGAGNDSLHVLAGSDGHNTVFGGSGNDLIDLSGDGQATAWAGTGNDSILVYGDGDNVTGGGNGDDSIEIVTNGGGTKTVYGGRGSDTIEANNNGHTSIFGGGVNPDGTPTSNLIVLQVSGTSEVFNGAGNDEVRVTAAATGDNTLWGGAGDDTFVFQTSASSGTIIFTEGNGHDTVRGLDFDAAQYIDLSDAGFSNSGEVLGAMSQQGSDVVLAVAPGQSVVFADMALSEFQQAAASDWLIL
jgi:serralysin